MSPALFLRSSAVLLSLSLISACGGSGGGSELKAEPSNCEVSGQSFGIVNGQTLASGNELSKSTVMVIHRNYKEEVSICTGTLVAKNKVLTAAHCISSFGGQTVIAFSNSVSCAASAPKRTVRAVTDTAVPDAYSYWNKTDFNNASTDLAVLKFTGSIPEGYEVRSLPTKSYNIANVDRLVMTGYGTTAEKGEDSGTLRFTTSPSSNVLGTSFYLALVGKTVSVPKTIIVDQANTGVCTGDSGGPLYNQVGSDLTLVGITSMGVDNRATDEKKVRVCHGVALFTDVREHLDWINEKIRSL
ncbi:S1 family peptidase [Bdellovibrio bacteriovorus]|uniref:Putative protease n=1 Tax=Bdellovibrio bacteriovorus str. Tiberius TaxID=1069642 RepID=K7YN20_BDEBC|nr:trypsin-like serine protease [Bdellovibrio bacteriovorus]AFY01231.1 putative protease [Bdellovibrio bacteriovorus str. Tiberius]